MAAKPKSPIKPVAAAVFAATRPAGLEPYVHGDVLPVPEVIEKDSDSVWELWSDAVKDKAGNQKEKEKEKEKADTKLEALPPTLLMGLDELPKDPDA